MLVPDIAAIRVSEEVSHSLFPLGSYADVMVRVADIVLQTGTAELSLAELMVWVLRAQDYARSEIRVRIVITALVALQQRREFPGKTEELGEKFDNAALGRYSQVLVARVGTFVDKAYTGTWQQRLGAESLQTFEDTCLLRAA